jgi:hypothetical protein
VVQVVNVLVVAVELVGHGLCDELSHVSHDELAGVERLAAADPPALVKGPEDFKGLPGALGDLQREGRAGRGGGGGRRRG